MYFIEVYNPGNIKKNKESIYLGIIFGISFYVRAEFLALMIMICFLLSIKKQFRNGILVFFISLIILSPWTIRNYITFGKIIPVTTSFGINFLNGHGAPKLDTAFYEFSKVTVKDSSYEFKTSEFAYHRAMYYIINYPLDELEGAPDKIFRLWIVDSNRDRSGDLLYLITWLSTLLFFFIGYYRSLLLKAEKNKLTFMNIYLMFSTVLVLVFFNVPRYQIQMSYLMIPTAMYGFYYLIYPLIKLYKNKTFN